MERRHWFRLIGGAAAATAASAVPAFVRASGSSVPVFAPRETSGEQKAAQAHGLAGEGRQSLGDTPQEIAIEVYKRENCSCCTKWVEHLKANGFAVTATEEPESELQARKERLGVPSSLRTCHTGTVNGVIIEGHVPADVIRRFLAEKPEGMAGLSVPGMPAGSPGMETEGYVQPYDIVAFDHDGNPTVYERREGTGAAPRHEP